MMGEQPTDTNAPPNVVKPAMSTSNKIALFALVASLLSLSITAYQSRQARIIAENTLRPYLAVNKSIEDGVYELVLVNEGVGPAIIKSFAVEHNGNMYSHYGEAVEVATSENGIGISRLNVAHGFILNDTPIGAGGEPMLLFDLSKSELSDDQQASVLDVVRNSTLVVTYQSVFETETFKLRYPRTSK